MDQKTFTELLAARIRAFSPYAGVTLDGDTDMIAEGLVDSMKITELILEVEGISGKRIPLEKFDIGQFRTIHRIYQTYVA